MAGTKTQPTNVDVAAWFETLDPARRRDEARALDTLFRQATGFAPVLWGDSIVGYGRYDYSYQSGRSGTSLATGFAPRKANLVLYIMPGYGDLGHILAGLGPHKLGKSCLYLKRLDAVNQDALTALIKAGLDDLGRRWPVQPT